VSGVASRPDDELDVRAALAGLAPPVDDDVSAGFFHRTLARWLGLPEGKQPGRKRAAPPLWDYDFWKAELVRDADLDDKRHYTAHLFRTADGEPEVVRYWVKLDAAGRIKQSGWLSAAPVLLDAGSTTAFKTQPGLDAGAIQRLFSREDETLSDD
jgi:hypothetical protein